MIPELILNFSEPWKNLSGDSPAIKQLEKFILPSYLKQVRWFSGKARKLREVRIEKNLSLSAQAKYFHLLIIRAKYLTGRSESYFLPVSLITSPDAVPGKGVICKSSNGYLIDAIYDEDFRKEIFLHLRQSSNIRQKNGALFFEKGSALAKVDFTENIISRVLDADQSNSSLIYEVNASSPGTIAHEYFLKIYRKLFIDINPDVEIIRFLTEQAHFTHIPSFAGAIYWQKASGAPVTLGMIQQKIEDAKDAWSLCGDYLNEFLFALSGGNETIPRASLEQAELLGTRTAELHIALGSGMNTEAFAPENFTGQYLGWLTNNSESLLKRRLRMIKDCYSSLDDTGRELSKLFLNEQDTVRRFFRQIRNRSFQSKRIRIHGDYHLGQILFDGNSYLITDFEGEPESSITDRKIKHSPLKDVAGMLRSFHYAVSAKLYFSERTSELPTDVAEHAVTEWYKGVTEKYLDAYEGVMKGHPVFTAERSEIRFLLDFHLLEKAVYELGYELNARPTWVKIPLKGIQQVLEQIQKRPV